MATPYREFVDDLHAHSPAGYRLQNSGGSADLLPAVLSPAAVRLPPSLTQSPPMAGVSAAAAGRSTAPLPPPVVGHHRRGSTAHDLHLAHPALTAATLP
ncbi:MAG TPA: hypothetical protein DIT03_00230 [Candidatus Accumulibacter sp.]|nr:hypothetical protein [Accumulibacter sp.]HCN66709.1 hypothetical protein [Accumulibacter sp.]